MNDHTVLQGTVKIMLKISVHLNPRHPSLLEIVAQSQDRGTFAEILQSEVQANLESLDYVSHVTVEPQ